MRKKLKPGIVSKQLWKTGCLCNRTFVFHSWIPAQKVFATEQVLFWKVRSYPNKAKLLKVKHSLTQFFHLAKTTLKISWHCKLQPLCTTGILQGGLLHLGLSFLGWRTLYSKMLFSWNLHIMWGFFLSIRNNKKKWSKITNCLRHFSPIKTTSWMRYHQALVKCDWNPFLLVQEVSPRAVPIIKRSITMQY